jgi:hypothetical protein
VSRGACPEQRLGGVDVYLATSPMWPAVNAPLGAPSRDLFRRRIIGDRDDQ